MENNKIKRDINNVINDNLKALEQLFPSAVKDGQLDIKALKEELGDFEEVTAEKYELNWAGKQNAKKIVQQGIGNKTLKFVEKDSKNADTTGNIYIEGDNLEVLKLLRQNYYNSIKMIYIDPPYNTGNDFVYNDTFKMDKEESDKAEGIISENNEKLQKNQKSTNRYHANWLNMMYPRLKVARDLLTDDGVIFISSNGAGGDIRKCETASVPAVIVDRDVHHGSADNIIVNNEKGGYDAASYLIGLGFTKIGCITGPEGISSSMQRMAGFKRALEENDIAFDEKFVYGGDFHYSGGRDAFLHLHLLLEMPQAVFACNDMMAIGFIHTAAAYGVRVPDDISVIGFDNTELSAVVSPTLTTIAQPIEEIAEIATERLLQKVENSSRDVKKIILEPHLIIRESCKRIF